jgi:3-hydroxyisobutyrate dehydrogenase-like beta-hydroxyacid dehydrogenase
MANPMFKGKGPSMIKGEFPAHFPLKHAQKDIRLALELAKSVGADLPTTTAANNVFLSVLESSGDEDFAAVYKAQK